jgi:hypothetical protein
MTGSVQQTGTAIVNIGLPDNVSPADCYVLPSPMDWTMQEVSNVDQTWIHMYQPPLTGDIDGDGISEIIVVNSALTGLRIYRGDNLSTPSRTFDISGVISDPGLALGTVRTKISETESKTFIMIHRTYGHLHAYNIDGTSAWGSVAGNYAIRTTVTFGFADFNHDGYAEIYIGNKIYGDATGVLLCDGGSNNTGYSDIWSTNTPFVTAVGDVLGNGDLQLVAGNQVYEVTITDRSSQAGNSMTVVKELPLGAITPFDGTTAIADINLDGRLDVVVRRCTFSEGSTMQMYVWTPSLDANGRLLAQKNVPNVVKAGLPLVGDIDGDKYPEIVFISGTSTNDVVDNAAFKYVPGEDELAKKWGFHHSDASGFTGLTLFDFNQDGISGLVYRDIDAMHIINGSLKSHITGNDTVVYDLSPPIACQSNTAAKYPVVADIDNDGFAEIVTTGTPTTYSPPV